MEAQGTESVGRVSKQKTIFNANSCINSITQLKTREVPNTGVLVLRDSRDGSKENSITPIKKENKKENSITAVIS